MLRRIMKRRLLKKYKKTELRNLIDVNTEQKECIAKKSAQLAPPNLYMYPTPFISLRQCQYKRVLMMPTHLYLLDEMARHDNSSRHSIEYARKSVATTHNYTHNCVNLIIQWFTTEMINAVFVKDRTIKTPIRALLSAAYKNLWWFGLWDGLLKYFTLPDGSSKQISNVYIADGEKVVLKICVRVTTTHLGSCNQILYDLGDLFTQLAIICSDNNNNKMFWDNIHIKIEQRSSKYGSLVGQSEFVAHKYTVETANKLSGVHAKWSNKDTTKIVPVMTSDYGLDDITNDYLGFGTKTAGENDFVSGIPTSQQMTLTHKLLYESALHDVTWYEVSVVMDMNTEATTLIDELTGTHIDELETTLYANKVFQGKLYNL